MSKKDSPFHHGEQVLQEQAGVRDRMEKFGRRVIRNHMPLQHRDFYQQQPFVVAAHVDNQGWPWASMLFGEKPGFIQSPDDKTLDISPVLDPLNPFKDAIERNQAIGLLGLELSSRRRNRLATRVKSASKAHFTLAVDQSFGNCPQYIQTREIEYIKDSERLPLSVHNLNRLDRDAKGLIHRSDTFFVASFYDSGEQSATNGADASHRGGKPGFVHIDEDGTLTIPDYAGNNHFNTLGNLLKNPKAGLLFVDFEHGHCLSLTGRTEILQDSPLIKHFNGAQRLWTFKLEKGMWLKNLLPFKFAFQAYSPNSLMTGDWQQAEQRLALESQKNQWRDIEVTDIHDESAEIKSFVLKNPQGVMPAFVAGQFLPIQVEIDGKAHTRTYSLSSAPDESHYRISVKRDGLVSNHLHNTLKVGSNFKVKAPSGGFTLQSQRPAVLIAAGIGVTPFVSMLKQAKLEQTKLRKLQNLILFFQVRNQSNQPFFAELNQLVQGEQSPLQVIWSMSQPESHLAQGKDFHYQGHINKQLLQAVLPLDDYDFLICGPGEFMQSQYDMLLQLGVQDKRIFAEAFGPAELKRKVQDADVAHYIPEHKAAKQADVKFQQSDVELLWSAEDGNLLDFAEDHGLQPSFSCRNGQCGSCKVNVIQGQVSHIQQTSFPLENNEALLCCAVPAESSDPSIPLIVDL